MSAQKFLHRWLRGIIYNDHLALVPKPLLDHWPERQFLRRFLARLDTDCVFDVGANVGQYARELRLIGFRGFIMSFEPDPSCFKEIAAKSAEDPKWKVFNVALGAEKRKLSLNVMANPVYNSFHRPATDDTENRVVSQVEVPVETLNDVLPRLKNEFGFRRVHLKMDTQGFDLSVFRGAAQVYESIVSMQSEVGIKRIYEDLPDWADVLKEYESEKFDIAGLYKVNPNLPDLIELNCYLRRSN